MSDIKTLKTKGSERDTAIDDRKRFARQFLLLGVAAPMEQDEKSQRRGSKAMKVLVAVAVAVIVASIIAWSRT